MNNKRKASICIYKITAAIFALLALAMCAAYFSVFHGGISCDPNDWDVFGSYFSVIIAIANLVFFIIITIHVAQIQDQSVNNQMSQEKKLHILDFKWKRLEDLNNIIISLQSIAIVNVNQENMIALYPKACKLFRAVNLYKKSNHTLFPEIDFNIAETTTKEFCEYIKVLKEKKEFTQDNVDQLNQKLNNLDCSLSDLTKAIQSNVLSDY